MFANNNKENSSPNSRNATMARSPSSNKKLAVAARGAKPLTKYFSPSPNKKKRKTSILNENSQNGARPLRLSEGTAASPVILESSNMETHTALVRISSATQRPPRKLSVRAGDPGVFLLKKGGVIGRSISKTTPTPSKNNKKINLGIHGGAGSGVSRKQLVVVQVRPLIMKQLNVTNLVSVMHYNQLLKTMASEPKRIPKEKKFNLKAGDVLEIDSCVRQGGGGEPKHVFRVVDCLVPKGTGTRPVAESVAARTDETVDLVDDTASATNKKRVVKAEPLPLPTVAEVKPKASRDSLGSTRTKRYDSRPSSADSQETLMSYSSNESPMRDSPQATDKEPQASKALAPKLPPQETKGSEDPKKKRAQPDKEPQKQSARILKHKLQPQETNSSESPTKKRRVSRRNINKGSAKGEENVESMPTIASPTVLAAPPVSFEETTDEEIVDDVAPLKVEPLVPKKGDECCALFESQDTFGVERPSWWPATVVKVTTKRRSIEPAYSLELEFKDKSRASYSFPDKDVQMLERSDDGFLYALIPSEEGGLTKKLTFDCNPKSLSLGDLVDAHYQNGTENDKWFRGRVAAIDSTTNTCTIAYEDGDLEAGVPIGQHKISLVEKGDECSWLKNFPVNDDFVARTQTSTKKKVPPPKAVIGKVASIKEDGAGGTALVIRYGQGGRKTAKMDYPDFARYAFESLLSRYNEIKTWPDLDISPVETKKTGEKKISGKPKQKKKVASRKKVEFRAEEWDISKKAEEKPEPKASTAGLKEMNLSVAKDFLRALNSTDPTIGSSMLITMARALKQGPSVTLGRSIRELICKGPFSDHTHFPDQHRVECAMSYLDNLSESSDGRESFMAAFCPADWATLNETLESIVQPQYTFEGDESSRDVAAWKRMIESLHLGSCGARFLSMLLHAELHEQVGSQEVDVGGCREGRFARAMRNHPDGIRHAVKAVVKNVVGAWVRFGHLKLLDSDGIHQNGKGPSKPAIRRCSDEAGRMLQELGTVLSYVFWLYSTCEGVKLTDKDLAFMVKESFDSESTDSSFDASVFMATKSVPTSYAKRLKLRVAICLDEDIVGDAVVAGVAKELGVANEYKKLVD